MAEQSVTIKVHDGVIDLARHLDMDVDELVIEMIADACETWWDAHRDEVRDGEKCAECGKEERRVVIGTP